MTRTPTYDAPMQSLDVQLAAHHLEAVQRWREAFDTPGKGISPVLREMVEWAARRVERQAKKNKSRR